MSDLASKLKQLREDMPDFVKALELDMSADPYGIPMTKLAAMLLMYHASKDAGYGRSWAKRGEVGVAHNMFRKADRYDRLASQMKMLEESALLVMSGHDMADEALRTAFIDLLVDIPLYCMMWLDWIIAVRPEDWQAWLDNVWSPVTGIDADTLVE